MIDWRRWLLITSAVIFVAMLLNISSLENSAPPKLLGKATQEQADYIMADITSRHFNASGKLQSSLTASELLHFPDRATYRILKPRVRFNRDKSRWYLSAKRGTLAQDGSQLKLLGNVELTSTPTYQQANTSADNTGSTRLKIAELMVDLNRGQAYSPYPVTVRSPPWKIQGVGVKINIEKQQLKILDKVFATNQPDTKAGKEISGHVQ